MGFLKRLFGSLASGGGGRADEYRTYVRCGRCGEILDVRVDLRNELTPTYDEGEGAYYVRKGVMGSGANRCFQTVEVELSFSADRQVVSRTAHGGEFVSAAGANDGA